MGGGERRVLLVDPPLHSHSFTVLGVPTLKAILERAGHATDSLCGTLLFPRVFGDDVRVRIRMHFAQFYFTPHLFPSVTREGCLHAIRESMVEQFGLQGAWRGEEASIFAEFGGDEAWFRRVVLEDIEHAGQCVERCVERCLDPGYDVVGFSVTFETQIPAAIAIATRLRAQRPEVVILFGGAACFGPAAMELVRSFPVIDAVCPVEGDEIIVPLVEAFRAPMAERAARLAAVPGVVWRDAGGPRSNPAPPLLVDLDTLPVPNYDDFMTQLAASEYADAKVHLSFEMSRGCWYGEKKLCSFCGLNAEGIAFRKKSADRFVDEVKTLYHRYPIVDRYCATDNILGMDYLKTVMPRLAEWRRTLDRPLKIFFEIKANLRREQVRVMRDAGIDYVQPGIESFNDGILKLMAKGSTGLGQVQIVKWLLEHRIGNVYHLLVLNPLETAQQYRELEALIPFIEHLPPPTVGSIELQRFSPYFTDPGSYGITNVRPRPYYTWAYPVPGIDLGKLAYRFDYDHAMFADAELIQARRAFVRRALRWGKSYRPERLYSLEQDESLLIIDQRAFFPRQYRLTGFGRALWSYIDQVRSFEHIKARFPEIAPALLLSLLDSWIQRRFVARDGERYLAVVPAQLPVEPTRQPSALRTRAESQEMAPAQG